MEMSSVVQIWGEWQLRVLVLGSLVLQFFLLFSSPTRKFAIPSWFRLCIWLAYLGSDAVAIYALATLFNRHRNQDCTTAHGGDGRVLEVIWAPILLLHLAGQDFITAYNIEDNELWTRQIVILLSQVAVTVYVFCTSWPGTDTGLSAAAVLLFIAVLLRYSDKPRALKRASFISLASSSFVVKKTAETEGDLSLERYVQEARQCVVRTQVAQDQREALKSAVPHLQLEPYEHFVDLAAPYSSRLKSLQSFLLLDDDRAYYVLRAGFLNSFNLLYTKGKLFRSNFSFLLRRLVGPIILIAAVPTFRETPKGGYKENDVKVTQILFLGTAVLEVYASCGTAFLRHSEMIERIAEDYDNDIPIWVYLSLPHLAIFGVLASTTWSNMVAQCNLIEFFAHSKKHAMMMTIARWFRCKDYLDRYYVVHRSSAGSITELVLRYMKEGWKDHIRDATTYRRFNDQRGQSIIRREGCYEQLGWSTEVPFDKGVLLWHIATDICFHCANASPDVTRCREMSDYMIYLLFICPEMLMAGTRKNLFTTACSELEHMFKDEKPPLDKRELAQKILDKVQSSGDATGGILRDSCKLARTLLELEENKRWKVIEGAWVEMLCYSASRCRGYLHAKSLGTGGEYLSYVWLLLSQMGMETFAQILQRPVPCENGGGEEIIDASTSGAGVTSDDISPF